MLPARSQERVLDVALEELRRSMKAEAPQAPRRAVNGARARGARRSPKEMDRTAEKVLDHLHENPGQRAEEIGAELGMSNKELSGPLAKLLEGKQVRKRGQKRATKYYPVHRLRRTGGKKTIHA